MRCLQRHTGYSLVGCGRCVSQVDALIRLPLGAVCRCLAANVRLCRRTAECSRVALQSVTASAAAPKIVLLPSACSGRVQTPAVSIVNIVFVLLCGLVCALSQQFKLQQFSTTTTSRTTNQSQEGDRLPLQTLPPNIRPLTSKPCPQLALKPPALEMHMQHAAIQI